MAVRILGEVTWEKAKILQEVDHIFITKLKEYGIDKNGYEAHVFEVKVKKDVILYDQNKDLLKQENKVISVDGVNGSEIVLGSMTEVRTSGNWPTIFDANKK